MSDKIRLLLADDHPLFRDGVSRTLAAERDMEVVAEFDDADAAVHAAADQLPDIAILDISMPGSGINAAKRIAQSCPVVKIVMLTVSEQDDDVIAALRAGARATSSRASAAVSWSRLCARSTRATPTYRRTSPRSC